MAPTAPLDEKWPAMRDYSAQLVVRVSGARLSSTDSIMRDEMGLVSVGYLPFFVSALAQSEHYDHQTVTPADVRKAMRAYDYDRAHQLFVDKGFGDPYVHSPIGLHAAVHFGALDVWDASVDFCCKQYMWSVADFATNPKEVQNYFYYAGAFGGGIWNVLLKRAEVTRRCLRAVDFSWATIDGHYDDAPKEVVGTWRPRGGTAQHAMVTADGITLASKLTWIVACTDDELPPVAQFLDGLLPAAELAMHLMPNDFFNAFANGIGFCNVIVFAALACERYGAQCWAEAISYCDQAMVTDMQRGGGDVATDRAIACLVRGRVRTAQGQTAAARKAFEDAAMESKRNGFELLAAIAYDARRKLLLGQGLAEGAREAAEREACMAGFEVSPDRLQAFLDA